ncbi:MAG TPA: molybdopterin cofactor-binding domain-containing protein [Candidatus Acidoferrales bacterium]|jgi:CO/xanthine dehydrogenase Mo-binding subunit|nr:molybdopterin cofactor-binding domain-containing protein [Candidatus Acidoferrales bacterium]
MISNGISRRDFVKTASGLVIGFSLFDPRLHSAGLGEQSGFNGSPLPTALDSWLVVGSDGVITVFTSKVDLGTGVLTALSQVMAEELDVSFERIHMITGDTAQTIDQSQTSGSRTLHKAGPQLRQAAAAGRHELLKLASAHLDVPVEQLTVNNGVVSVVDNPSANITYWKLLGGRRFDVTITATGTAAEMKVAPEITPKNPKDYKIVGSSIPRIDLPAKFTGEFTYSQDVRIPGMLHGRPIRPEHPIAGLVSVDESSIKDIPGIVKVVKEDHFVGVVATTEWSAIRASQALKVVWSAPPSKLPATRDDLYSYMKETKPFKEQPVANRGDVDSALSRSSRVFEATYHWPFHMHGMIGPSCAVADVRDGKATIWAGSQGTHRTRKAVADLLRVPENNVRVVYAEGSGCYGRLCADDVAEDAALMSRAVNKPVRVQWMRHEEHAWEPKGTAQLMTVRAGIDPRGNITAWDFTDRYFPYTAGPGTPLLASTQTGLLPDNPGFPGNGYEYGTTGSGDVYAFENQRINCPVIPWIQNAMSNLRTCNLRAPGAVGRTFASESFIDEVAFHAGIDPVQFRLRSPRNQQRTGEILLAAAKKASWVERPSPAPATRNSDKCVGRGVAISDRDGAIVAAVAEVEVEKSSGKVKVNRVTIAHDCGLIANPDGLRNQIEGNVVQGVSRTLFEEVHFDENGVTNLDWNSYRTIRFQDIPEIEIILIDRPELGFLGAGEASIIPVPAAIANAVFDATGARVRDIPLTPDRVLAALSNPEPRL